MPGETAWLQWRLKLVIVFTLSSGMLVGWGDPRGFFQFTPMILWGFIAKSRLEMALDFFFAWKSTAAVVHLSVCAHVKMGLLFLLQLVNVLALCTWGIMTLLMDKTCSRMHTKSLLEARAFQWGGCGMTNEDHFCSSEHTVYLTIFSLRQVA